MKYRESISEPPLDKLEQIRQKYSKQLTKVKAKGFIGCSIGKCSSNESGSMISFGKSSFLDKLQSINSFEDDERTLLKSIQCDVQLAIKRYQQRIEQIAQIQVERSSLKSCQQEFVQYMTTPQQEKVPLLFDSHENTKRSHYESAKPTTNNSFFIDKNTKPNKSILNKNKSNLTFKIIAQKDKKQKPKKKTGDLSLADVSLLKKKSQDGTCSLKSASTRQPSVREITINLDQRRSTDRLSKFQTSRQKNSVKQDIKTKKLQVF